MHMKETIKWVLGFIRCRIKGIHAHWGGAHIYWEKRACGRWFTYSNRILCVNSPRC